MNRIKRTVAIILITSFMISVSGCATYMRHPDFKERHKDIRYVSIMPPKIDIYKLTFKGDKEMMFDLLDPTAKISIDEIKKILDDKNKNQNWEL